MKIVLSNYEGLGDLLLLSTLPERFTKEWGAEVYLSKADKPPRNQEVSELLFRGNPFIRGYSTDMPTAGMVKAKQIGRAALMHAPDPIGIVERVHGLEPPYNRFPKLYHTFDNPIAAVQDAVLFDMSCFSQRFSQQQAADFIEHMIRPRYAGLKWYQVMLKSYVTGHRVYDIPGAEKLPVPNLRTYLDMMASCHAYVGLEAGGHALAAAVRGENAFPEVHCLMSTRTFNGRVFVWPNVERCIVNNNNPDHWEPHWP